MSITQTNSPNDFQVFADRLHEGSLVNQSNIGSSFNQLLARVGDTANLAPINLADPIRVVNGVITAKGSDALDSAGVSGWTFSNSAQIINNFTDPKATVGQFPLNETISYLPSGSGAYLVAQWNDADFVADGLPVVYNTTTFQFKQGSADVPNNIYNTGAILIRRGIKGYSFARTGANALQYVENDNMCIVKLQNVPTA